MLLTPAMCVSASAVNTKDADITANKETAASIRDNLLSKLVFGGTIE